MTTFHKKYPLLFTTFLVNFLDISPGQNFLTMYISYTFLCSFSWFLLLKSSLPFFKRMGTTFSRELVWWDKMPSMSSVKPYFGVRSSNPFRKEKLRSKNEDNEWDNDNEQDNEDKGGNDKDKQDEWNWEWTHTEELGKAIFLRGRMMSLYTWQVSQYLNIYSECEVMWLCSDGGCGGLL